MVHDPKKVKNLCPYTFSYDRFFLQKKKKETIYCMEDKKYFFSKQ